MTLITAIFGALALIFMVAALASGRVERAPISFPMICLGLGYLAGEHGLGWVKVGLHDPVLETVAILSLAFVLFLDAINLHLEQLRETWIIPVLTLGPGTLLTMVLVAIAAFTLLGFPPIQALLTGAVLASVDPVLLRDVVSDRRIPRAVRESLRTEAGANDMIVLPVLLLLAAIDMNQGKTSGGWLVFLARLFIVGPVAGFAVGAIAARLMKWASSRTPISREYQALYGVGVLLAAYFAGSILGDSGFLAVFAAGLATSLLDTELCDCFLDYSGITAEMTMLLAFLLFGSLLSTLIGTLPLLPVLAFALLTLVVARPVAIGIVLRRANISRRARLFIGWFGPRGLSTLLFGLLLVSAGVPGAQQILAAAGVVVTISVVAHGVSAGPLAARYSQAVRRETLPEERESGAAGLFIAGPDEVPRITPQELAVRLESPEPPIVLDVRSRSTYGRDPGQIPGSIRVLPDEVSTWADGRPKDREIVTYCT